MLKYTDVTQSTYVQSWTVTEIMAREKCGILAGPHTVPASWQSYTFPSLCVVSYDGNSTHAHSYVVGLYRNAHSAMLRHRWAISCIVLGNLRTTMTWVRLLMCCWPCIFAMINFRFQLMHYNSISLIIFLYMFRAPMCPSSGGSTIHSQQLVQCHLIFRPYSR